MENKIALVGDIHIGVNLNSEEFFQITKDWVNYLIDDLSKRDISEVFVLGDWHHYRDEIDVKTMDFSSQIMEIFASNDIKVHILTGNHDCYLKDTSEIHSLQMFKRWDNVEIYDKPVSIVAECGKIIEVFPWGEEVRKLGEDVDYVFGHFEIKNFKFNSYQICNDGVDSKSVLKRGADVYTGHFHQKQSKDYKNASINYVGSPFQHNFNDVDNQNGYHILDLPTGDCEFVKNEGFPVFKHLKYGQSLAKENIENNFVKLILNKDVKEKDLEKEVAKVWSFNPRKVVIDDKTTKKGVDIGEKDVNIEEINLSENFEEFIDTLGDQVKHKDRLLTKIKELLNKYD